MHEGTLSVYHGYIASLRLFNSQKIEIEMENMQIRAKFALRLMDFV